MGSALVAAKVIVIYFGDGKGQKLGDKMVDAPHLRQAQRVLAQAQAADATVRRRQ